MNNTPNNPQCDPEEKPLLNEIIRETVQHIGEHGPAADLATFISLKLAVLGALPEQDEDYFIDGMLDTGVIYLPDNDEDEKEGRFILTDLGKYLFEQSQEHPYAEILEPCPDLDGEIFTVAYNALGEQDEPGEHDPERAKALLKKILGNYYKHAYLQQYDRNHPTFGVADTELVFYQGMCPEDDVFLAGPHVIRDLAGLGFALVDTIDNMISLGDALKEIKFKITNTNPKKKAEKLMDDTSYANLDLRRVKPIPQGLSIAAIAIDAFRTWDKPIMKHNPERAKALLEKVLGNNSKYAWLKHNHRLHPVFSVDGFELSFTQGATLAEDQFLVSYLGQKSDIPVRSMPALGVALYHCFDLAEKNDVIAHPDVRASVHKLDPIIFKILDEHNEHP